MQKSIKGYSNYMVSENGIITNAITGRTLRGTRHNNGYIVVELKADNGERKQLLVHRLVAEAFIPNPDRFPIINHKDENPSNNTATNLEWCSYKYNINYGTAPARRDARLEAFRKSERIKTTARENGKTVMRAIIQMTKDGEIINRYASGKDAAIKTEINHSHILEVCAGKRKSAGGYRWRYEKGRDDLSAFQ